VQFSPDPYEIRLFFLCPWFVSFAAHYAIKGAAPNRDRSKSQEYIIFTERLQCEDIKDESEVEVSYI
jgi:hypothetical protein